MFTPESIKERLRAQPFVPVRIVTSTRENYDIYHPDMALVTREYVMIGLPSTPTTTVPNMVTRVAVLHIAELRDLPQVSVASN